MTNQAAIAHFTAELSHTTDPSDLSGALDGPDAPVVVDSRGDAAWRHGRLPGAVHLPTARIAAEATTLIPPGTAVVVYCWGPGCNGATKAALAFARLGYPVRSLLGGYEYWVREGLPVETAAGTSRSAPDALTAPPHAAVCDC